jgi:hypothetical protein
MRLYTQNGRICAALLLLQKVVWHFKKIIKFQMKRLTTIILIIIGGATYSQKLKDKLQGDWVCTKILDSKGKATSGKFGESNEYLKFSFAKGNLSITEAPFDRGIKMPIKYDVDFIDLFPQAVYELPEKKYTFKSQEGTDLVLSAKNQNGEIIDYHFVNQERLLKELSPGEHLIDNGLIIIKHLKLSKEAKGANRVSEYRISNEAGNLYPSPIFNDYASASFGHYCSINFVFPKNYQLETVSEELIVDFDIDDKGVSNIKVVQGLGDEINALVIKIIEKTRKKWEPLKINGQPIKTTLRFHFIFYLGVVELGIRFAK